MPGSIHLNLFVHGRGHHEAGWRHPGASQHALTDIDYYSSLAKRAEQGLFDSIFLADSLALGDGAQHVASGALEPVTALAALAQVTAGEPEDPANVTAEEQERRRKILYNQRARPAPAIADGKTR